jgi:hypothetical protein
MFIFYFVILWKRYGKLVGIEYTSFKKRFLLMQQSICFLVLLSSFFAFVFYQLKQDLPLVISSVSFLFSTLAFFALSFYAFSHHAISLSENLSALLSLVLSVSICTVILVWTGLFIADSDFSSIADFYKRFILATIGLLDYLLIFSAFMLSGLIFCIIILRKKYELPIDDKSSDTVKKYLSAKRRVYFTTLLTLAILLIIILLLLTIGYKTAIEYIIVWYAFLKVEIFFLPLLFFFEFIIIIPVLFRLQTTHLEKIFALVFLIFPVLISFWRSASVFLSSKDLIFILPLCLSALTFIIFYLTKR